MIYFYFFIGLAQSVILTGFAVFGMASNYSYPWVLSQVAQFSFMGPALIFLGKFAIAWPVMYHLFNGCRHLVSNFNFIFCLSCEKADIKGQITSEAIFFAFNSPKGQLIL